MPPHSTASPPPASQSRRMWVALMFGMAVVEVVAVFWVLDRMVELPGTMLEKGKALVKEMGQQAATVAGAFRGRTIRQEFLSSSVTLTGTKRLQVATLQEHETFRRKEQDSAVWGWIALPEIVVQADVPVEYTYYLDFDGAWDFQQENDLVTVYAPPILTNAPAPDISKLTFYTLEGHIWQDDKAVRGRLQGTLSTALRARALEHVPLVREIARRQLETFVEKWMASSFRDAKAFRVKVVFPDEKEHAAPVEKKG